MGQHSALWLLVLVAFLVCASATAASADEKADAHETILYVQSFDSEPPIVKVESGSNCWWDS